mmetsp:Transcript_2569/g.5364  ORF Transcript_2569/g.5364 Transcript_2569/m.5364 type:complete len:240 (-) Transcript_2569:57-776(-)
MQLHTPRERLSYSYNPTGARPYRLPGVFSPRTRAVQSVSPSPASALRKDSARNSASFHIRTKLFARLKSSTRHNPAPASITNMSINTTLPKPSPASTPPALSFRHVSITCAPATEAARAYTARRHLRRGLALRSASMTPWGTPDTPTTVSPPLSFASGLDSGPGSELLASAPPSFALDFSSTEAEHLTTRRDAPPRAHSTLASDRVESREGPDACRGATTRTDALTGTAARILATPPET